MQTNTATTTAAHAFFSCNPAQERLFSVRPGIPAEDALITASNFLDVARTCAYEGTETENLSSAAAYLIEMAKAVIDALAIGTEAKPDDRLVSNTFARLTSLHESGTIIINPLAIKMQSDDAQGFLDWASQQAKGGAQ